MALLQASRERALALLRDTSRPIGETLALVLLYGCQVQGALDGGEVTEFDTEAALETAREMAQTGDMGEVISLFQSLEILTDVWQERLNAPQPGDWDGRTRNLARYFAGRYWLQAVADYDLYSRVKFLVTSCLLLRHLGGDFERTAQLFSKEIENDADNVDALLDAAYDNPALADAKLLGMLL